MAGLSIQPSIQSSMQASTQSSILSAIASLPGSAEHEGEEGEDQDDDDDEAAAIGPATIDAALPLLAEGGFLVHSRRVVCADKAGHALYTIVI